MQSVVNLFYERKKQPIYLASIILMSICVLPHAVVTLILFFAGIYQLIQLIKEECSFCGLC